MPRLARALDPDLLLPPPCGSCAGDSTPSVDRPSADLRQRQQVPIGILALRHAHLAAVATGGTAPPRYSDSATTRAWPPSPPRMRSGSASTRKRAPSTAPKLRRFS